MLRIASWRESPVIFGVDFWSKTWSNESRGEAMASAKKEADKVLTILLERLEQRDIQEIIYALKREVKGKETFKDVVDELFKKITRT